MEIKKIVFASVITVMLMSTVFFSPQEADALGQWIMPVDYNGGEQAVFLDYTQPDCRAPDAVYISGANFVPNSYVDIYTTSWPDNGNENGLFAAPPPGGYPVIDLDDLGIYPVHTVYTDANGDFDTRQMIVEPIIGDWNFIAHQSDGTSIWNHATDTIDTLNHNGFAVHECLTGNEEEDVDGISVGANQRIGETFSAGFLKPNGDYVSLIYNINHNYKVDGSDVNSIMYVMNPDDDGQLSADGEYQILTSIDNSDNDFGKSTATGDFNGDGIDDVAIGVPHADKKGKKNAGAVNVFYGSSSGELSERQTLYLDLDGITGKAQTGDSFGWSLAVGNFNGDNYDDLAIGVPNHSIDGHKKAGMVSVIYGSEHKLDPATSQKWYQDSPGIHGASQTGDRLGYTLTTGDFDNNGTDDLVIGVPYEDVGKQKDAGAVNVIYGGIGNHEKLSSSHNQLWHQNSKGIKGTSEKDDRFGWSLTTGDYKNNGHDALAIGVAYEDVNHKKDAGAVNVIYGGIDSHPRLSSVEDQIWYQGEKYRLEGHLDKGDNFGYSLTSGDFNGDSFEDLAIGVPDEMINNKPAAGGVNVIYGAYGGLNYPHNQLWSLDIDGMLGSSEHDDRFGWSMIAADFDNDGIADLVVGMPYKHIDNVPDVGAISMIYGEEIKSWQDRGGLDVGGNQYWRPGD